MPTAIIFLRTTFYIVERWADQMAGNSLEFQRTNHNLPLSNISKMTNINPNRVKQAIIDYRNAGRQLMLQLGQKFGLDIHNDDEFEQLITKNNFNIPRKGQLTQRWNYRFHGGECEFYNIKNQQSVEVVLSNSPEFGAIDCWFLMKYMASTELYKKDVDGIEWADLIPVVNSLYSAGDIVEIRR